ncbi:unnamed protein product [Psylliodes chrysocephalus]|uniref:Uncharacterized protein n=1 Tax=Psylliodes chrysocephalus TaxID=3402493 RepID=A0A9P0D577_9CUCU|nr:unnamed protein product [Psylliodes chrysocephala]
MPTTRNNSNQDNSMEDLIIRTCTEQTNMISQQLDKKFKTFEENIQALFGQQSATAENSTQEAITQPLPMEQSSPLKKILSPDTNIIHKVNSIFTLPKIKPNSKKTKSNSTPPTVLSSNTNLHRVEPAKDFIINHSSSLILNYDQLQLLLTNITGLSDSINVVQENTSDMIAVTHVLSKIYPHIKDPSLKRKFTTLKRKIFAYLGNDVPESNSDTSHLSQERY